MDIIEDFRGKLIVSCQALENEPLYVPGYMAKMALAAKLGGAVGIRANSPEDIKSIKNEIDIPVIGIWKQMTKGNEVYITPTIEAARAVYNAGADIIAIDCTFRKNLNGEYAWELIKKIKKELNILVMADVSTLEEAINAEREGADLVSTTLSGYTEYTRNIEGPDFNLIEDISKVIKIPVMAEGRIGSHEDAVKALEAGAHAVIIGAAITRPKEITKGFVDAIKASGSHGDVSHGRFL
jgi:N-acylglucosamine-6-phosphate 2-epimerase